MAGAELATLFCAQAVRPLLEHHRPGLPHAAGRLGTGSDVLGLDDDVSRDHDWGLRLTLTLPAADVRAVDAALAAELPAEVAGHPTRFATTGDPLARHRVEVTTVDDLARTHLGLAATAPWDALDWLSLTGQAVLEVTAGAVLADSAGELTRLRERLAWYPDEVWRHVVACDWARLPARATGPFHDRRYRGVADEVVTLLRADVRDPRLRALGAGVGSVEQCVDSVDVLVAAGRRGALVRAWRVAPPVSPGTP